MKSKVLFLTTDLPFPNDSGGKIRTLSIIKSLSIDNDIDIVCFSEKDDNDVAINELKKYCNKVEVVNMIFTNKKSKKRLLFNLLKAFIKNKPFVIEKFNNSGYRKKVRKLISENKYNHVIFDHLQVGNYLNEIKDNEVILSQHNCEYLIVKRMYEEETNFLKKLYLKMEYLKTQKYEIDVMNKSQKVIMLSKEDKDTIVSCGAKSDNIEIIPICIEEKYTKKHYENKVKNILFIGTMSWYPNEQGVLWFIDNVWKKVKEIDLDYKLYVVGNKPSKKLLERKTNDIIVTGYVEDINEYIEKCDVCIIPLFIGGGMRVKILECMSKGIPCISTSIGAEGIRYTNSENILIADTVEDFVNVFSDLNNNKINLISIADEAKKLINEQYSMKKLYSDLKILLEK